MSKPHSIPFLIDGLNTFMKALQVFMTALFNVHDFNVLKMCKQVFNSES